MKNTIKKLTLSIMTVFMFCTSAFAGSIYWVDGYSRSDGTYVTGHYKTTPDAYKWNNLGN